jgi:hypothetical protein
MRIMGAALVLLGGCTEEKFYSSGLPTPMAVGASAAGAIYSESCTKIDKHVDCEMPAVTSSYELKPAGVFSLSSTDTRYTVTAIAEGDVTLTIHADNGTSETFLHPLTALAIDNVAVKTLDASAAPCTLPPRYQVGTTVELEYVLQHGITPLYGAVFPFTASAGTVAQSDEYDRVLDLTMPATTDTVTLTSSADPAFSLAVRGFTPAEVTAIELGELEYPLTVALSSGAPMFLSLGDGTRVCANQLSRTTTSITPDVCRVFQNTPAGMISLTSTVDFVQVLALKPGTCTLSVALDGTAIASTHEFIVAK